MGLGSLRHTYKNASCPTDFRFPPPSIVSTNDSHEEAGREEEKEEKQKGPTSGHVRRQANCQPSTPTPRSFLERKVGRSGCPLRRNGFETDRGCQQVLQAGNIFGGEEHSFASVNRSALWKHTSSIVQNQGGK